MLRQIKVATDAQPSPRDFHEVYREIADQGDSIVSVHPSRDLTGTYVSACMARDALPWADIHVVDTRQASMAEGLLAIEAARAAVLGIGKDDILNMMHTLVKRVNLYVALDSLEFIVRSGSIGRAKGFLASVLHIKPIITIGGGVIEPLDRVRGAAKVIPRLVELAQGGVKTARVRASVIHAHALNAAVRLKDEVERKLQARTILASGGPAIVTNAGPGSFGLAVMELPEDHPVPASD